VTRVIVTIDTQTELWYIILVTEVIGVRYGGIDMNKQQAIKDMIEYIDKHYLKYKYTPSLRDIEAELGFSRQTAMRYLQELDKQGVLKYDGKTVITQRIAQLTTDDTVRVPVVGSIPCGIPTSEEQTRGKYLSIPKSWVRTGKHYILKASGDSMIDAGIDDGDLVLIKMTKKAELGQIVAALDENNQSTLKRLVFDAKKERPVLHAENKRYKDICPQQIVIQGVAVKVIKDLL